MSRLALAATWFLMLAIAPLVAAGDVVEVRVLKTEDVWKPATQPSDPIPKLEGAKLLAAIETACDGVRPFEARAVIGDATISFSGTIQVFENDHRRLTGQFSFESATGMQSVSTSVTLRLNQEVVIGASSSEVAGSTLIVARVKPEVVVADE